TERAPVLEPQKTQRWRIWRCGWLMEFGSLVMSPRGWILPSWGAALPRPYFEDARNWSAGLLCSRRLALVEGRRAASAETGGRRTRLWRDAHLAGETSLHRGESSRRGTSGLRVLPTGREAWSFR